MLRILSSSLSNTQSSLFLTWGDLKSRYLGSVLGPLWLVLGFAIFATGLAVIWSRIFGYNIQETFPYFSVGLTVWMFTSSVISQAPTHFIEKRDVILNINYSYYHFSVGVITQHSITFLHYYIFVIPLLLYFHQEFTMTTLYVIPGFFLVILNLYWMCVLLGFLGARFRDLSPLINALLQPIFFLTPVIYREDQLGSLGWVINLNIFTHFINVIRAPILGDPINYISLVALSLIGFLGIKFTANYVKQNSRFLPYWVN